MLIPVAFTILLLSTASVQGLPQTTTRNTGCHANVCFALDGSATITPEAYTVEKDLVTRITRILTRRGAVPGLAAVQYGLANHAVSPFTKDRSDFLRAVSASQQHGDEGSFVTAGLNYCFGALLDVDAGAKTIVLLGDGRATIGSDPADRANLFYLSGGQVLVAGVGDSPDVEALTRIAGGNSQNVFMVDQEHEPYMVANRIVDSICS